MRSFNKSLVIDFIIALTLLLMSSCSEKSISPKVEPYRVIVSTDIGGTDPDDYQSMVHLFLYADTIDIEGLISSPYGDGRKKQILEVIDHYENDYPNLSTYSDKYPTADSLRKITKQGAIDYAEYKGFDKATEGSDWIIECARRDDDRPLYVLVWGGIEDLAQALHDAPDILPKLRVYYIGGPNKKWSPDAYQYITDNHPTLFFIESNATYRGWFTGGNQSEEWSNTGFPAKHISGKGALGNFFMTQLGGRIKMGDTPSLAWLLKGNNADPSKPSWGGRYVRAWDRPYYKFTTMPNKNDSVEEFSILELVLDLPANLPEKPEAFLKVENQSSKGHFADDGTVRFRFSPKSHGVFKFEVNSNINELNGKTGEVISYIPPPELANNVSEIYTNWWTDDPNLEFIEGNHIGAKTVSKWREEFLEDFAKRIMRCASPSDSN